MGFFDDLGGAIFGKAPSVQGGPTALSSDQLHQLMALLFPQLMSQYGFMSQLQPGYQNAVKGQIALAAGDPRPGLISQLGQTNQAQAVSGARIADNSMRGAGLGEGFRSGAISGAMDQASGQTADAAAKMYSPEYDWNRAQTLTSAYSGGLSNDPFTSLLAKLQQIVTSQSQTMVPGQEGMLGQLAQAAATYYGGKR